MLSLCNIQNGKWFRNIKCSTGKRWNIHTWQDNWQLLIMVSILNKFEKWRKKNAMTSKNQIRSDPKIGSDRYLRMVLSLVSFIPILADWTWISEIAVCLWMWFWDVGMLHNSYMSLHVAHIQQVKYTYITNQRYYITKYNKQEWLSLSRYIRGGTGKRFGWWWRVLTFDKQSAELGIGWQESLVDIHFCWKSFSFVCA